MYEVDEEVDIEIVDEQKRSRLDVLLAAMLFFGLIAVLAIGLLVSSCAQSKHVKAPVSPQHHVSVVKGEWWLGRMAQTKNELGFIADWKVAALKGGNHIWYRELVAREQHFAAQLAWQTAHYEAIVHKH